MPVASTDWPAQIAPTLNAHFGDKQGLEDQHALNGGGCSSQPIQNIAHAVACHMNKGGDPTTDNYAIAYRTSGNCGPFESGEKTAALNTATDPNQNIIIFDETQITSPDNYSNPKPGDASHPLAASARPPTIAIRLAQTSSNGCGIDESGVTHTLDSSGGDAVLHGKCQQVQGVRRLTVVECARLQGFSDSYNEFGIDANGAKVRLSESARYRQYGNAVSVPVAQWIARRVKEQLAKTK